MPKKSSAYYQRQYRERLRSQGLVKKEVWIIPDHAKTLSAVETLLRDEVPATDLSAFIKRIGKSKDKVEGREGDKKDEQANEKNISIEDRLNANNATNALSKAIPKMNEQRWTTRKLFATLQQQDKINKELLHVKLSLIEPSVPNDEPIIYISMQEFGDLPIFMTVQGEQIIVETILCMVDEITNVYDFNDMVLRTHKYFPLSTISLDTLTMADGNSYDAYQMFGSLSSYTGIDEIVHEIQTLANNVMQALEAYNEYFITPS